METSRLPFKLGGLGLWLVLLPPIFPGSALAATGGHVDFAIGNVVVTDAKGQARALARGTEVGSGDRISSGADGRAQIRFSDGAYMSVQPNTEFDIKQYQFDGKADGTESAFFGLFKGALRTVTGLVGRINKNRYQIATPTATIGIRGTGGLIQIGADGSTLVIGSSGIWTLTNNGGTLDVPAGTAGFAGTNRNVAPQPTTTGPVIPPPQPTGLSQPPVYVQGDTTNTGGAPGSLSAAATLSGSTGLLGGQFLSAPTNAVFNGAGQMTQFTVDSTSLLFTSAVFLTAVDILPVLTTATSPTSFTFTLAGTHADFGTDGTLAWGRWIGDVIETDSTGASGTVTFGPNDGFHYVVGIPTPVSNLPTAGTFTYNLIGATQPTFVGGAVAPGTLTSATLTGNFTAGTVDVSLSANAGGGQFNGSVSGMPISSLNNAAVFTNNLVGTTTASGTGCANNTCTLHVNGFFAGVAASHAGINYDFGNTILGTSADLVGAAALKR